MELDKEDYELRDLLSQTLETKGVLGNIRAQLRASIFLALEDEDKLNSHLKSKNNELKSFLQSSDGRQAFNLVAELLEHFNLKHSLAVLTQEAGLDAAGVVESRDPALGEKLGDGSDVRAKSEPKLVKILRDSTNSVK